MMKNSVAKNVFFQFMGKPERVNVRRE